ncbi:hypothetical protein F3157_07215 [Virgibacillus dakarensis]|uniref:Uncharacterized protein n=1 Tax=Lentibacillus populi TaxID=1827502 RepID=A0A9W5TWM1_9BACI|nr:MULTISPECIES: hypothetical protein [Bacillaceae]MTW85451.1 hypothetical protein [Virgibacillus dakarensis]GGB39731.1 hypothetical protein GCM10011409_16540 [Lentibacillus populi]
MPRLFIHFTFILFTLTALSGLWMRLFSFFPSSTIPYTNVMHAHSHLAILGWAFIGVFLIFLTLFWKSIRQKRQAIALMITIFITSFLMFTAFIYQGYGVYSIIISSIHIFTEYWAALFIYRQLKQQNNLPNTSRLFINGSLIALIISSIGPFSLGFISANGLRNSPIFDMAIYFYLHFQYNGWLYLVLIGLFIIVLHQRRIHFHHSLVKTGFWIYFAALFPGYFLSVLWGDLGSYGSILATIGSIGQWIGVLALVVAFKGIWLHLYKQVNEITIVCLWITFFLLVVKSTMELGLISPTMAELVYQTRSIIIGYLHFTLLGFVSIFILTQYQLARIIETKKILVQSGIIIFLIGFLVNELFLFGDGLARWCGFGSLPFFSQGLLAASVLLAIGILIIWLSFSRQKKQAV